MGKHFTYQEQKVQVNCLGLAGCFSRLKGKGSELEN